MAVPTIPLEHFWAFLLRDEAAAAALVEPDGSWDDPLFDAAHGAAVRETALPRLGSWLRGKITADADAIQHLRTIADDRRVVVEGSIDLRDGVIWNQAEQRSEAVDRFALATALVGDRSTKDPSRYSAIRIYFSTWSALKGASRLRVGPICPDERAATAAAMDAMPVLRRYFDALAVGDPSMAKLFEPDGYFREPANNFACGPDQLADHFQNILKLGGVGIELLTATRQDDRLGIELQTVVWGTKRMDQPQAGFAAYELGPHGKIQGARVYDSVIPPEL